MGLNQSARTLRRVLAAELLGAEGIPLTTKVWLWRRGFKSVSYRLFDLAHHDPREFVSDLEVARAKRINGAYGRVLKDKLLFASLFSGHCTVPEVYGVIERGEVHPLSRPELRSTSALLELCPRHPVILKPAQGNKGKGVLSLSAGPGGLRLNGNAATAEHISRTLAQLDNYLIVARVEQAAYAEAIFAGATNTIRIVTLKDPESGEVFVPAAIHRFGTAATAPTDNFQTGGISASVDVASGVLGRAACFPKHAAGALQWVDVHPDTGAQITGVSIPRWGEVKSTVLGLVETFPFLRYVGWDIAVSEGGVVVIEGNHNINLGLQVHGPLLRDARTRRFYEHYGVVRAK